MNSIPQYKYKIKVNYDYLLKKYPLTKNHNQKRQNGRSLSLLSKNLIKIFSILKKQVNKKYII